MAAYCTILTRSAVMCWRNAILQDVLPAGIREIRDTIALVEKNQCKLFVPGDKEPCALQPVRMAGAGR